MKNDSIRKLLHSVGLVEVHRYVAFVLRVEYNLCITYIRGLCICIRRNSVYLFLQRFAFCRKLIRIAVMMIYLIPVIAVSFGVFFRLKELNYPERISYGLIRVFPFQCMEPAQATVRSPFCFKDLLILLCSKYIFHVISFRRDLRIMSLSSLCIFRPPNSLL